SRPSLKLGTHWSRGVGPPAGAGTRGSGVGPWGLGIGHRASGIGSVTPSPPYPITVSASGRSRTQTRRDPHGSRREAVRLDGGSGHVRARLEGGGAGQLPLALFLARGRLWRRRFRNGLRLLGERLALH